MMAVTAKAFDITNYLPNCNKAQQSANHIDILWDVLKLIVP